MKCRKLRNKNCRVEEFHVYQNLNKSMNTSTREQLNKTIIPLHRQISERDNCEK